jgi:hypothetical protein
VSVVPIGPPVYDTADFVVRVEERHSTEIGPVLTYRVRNKTTDVPEYEDYLLSRTIETMLNMQNLLDTMKEEYKSPSKEKMSLTTTFADKKDDIPVH